LTAPHSGRSRPARYLPAYADFHRRRVAEDGVPDDRLFLRHGGNCRDGEEMVGEPLGANGVKLIFRRLTEELKIKLLLTGRPVVQQRRILGERM
jgi:hypothetical protein